MYIFYVLNVDKFSLCEPYGSSLAGVVGRLTSYGKSGENPEKDIDNHWCNFRISAGQFRSLKIESMQSFVLKYVKMDLPL